MAPREAYVLGTQYLVRGVMLEHAMLMDACLMSKSILADDRLVARDRQARDARHQTRGWIQAARLDTGGDIEERLAGLQRHDNFLQRAVAGALADSIDRAFPLPGSRDDGGQAVRHRHAQIVVTMVCFLVAFVFL